METNIQATFSLLMGMEHGHELEIDYNIKSNSLSSQFSRVQEKIAREAAEVGITWQYLSLRVRTTFDSRGFHKYVSVKPREVQEFTILAGDELLYAGYKKGITSI